MKNSISVIIPMYNAGEYIQECLDSVQKQTLKPYEIIVVDDGSTDKGGQIVEQIPSVKLIAQANAGVTAARRRGVEAATGEWIYFMDADDTLPPMALEKLVAGCTTFTDMVVGTKDKECELSRAEFAGVVLKSEIWVAPFNKLYRRNLFDNTSVLEIPREIVRGEDMLMLLRLANSSLRKVVLLKCLEYNYRSHSGQVTKTFATNSEYETMFHYFLKQSLSQADQKQYLPLLIQSRINALSLIILRQKETHDYGVKQTAWFHELQEDMKKVSYKPNLWEYLFLHVATSNNINWILHARGLVMRFKRLM